MGFFGGGGASVDLASPPAIGNTTPNTGAFTTLNTSNIFGNGSPDGGVAIRPSASSTSFVECISGVIFSKIGNNIHASIGRSSTKSFCTTSDGFFGWGSSTTNADAATPNASLFSDAANILAQRKGTNAQTFRLYNTYTDASNYERGFFSWNTNVLEIGAEAAGTGTKRTTRIIAQDKAGGFGPILELGFYPNNALSKRLSFTNNSGAFIQFGIDGTFYGNFSSDGFCVGTAQLGFSASSVNAIDVSLNRDAADILAQRRTTNAQTFRLYNTFTSSTNFERLNLRWASNEFILDAEKGSVGGTLRGVKIGSATTSLLGFYGVTPVDQPATVTDPTGGLTVDAEARTAINAIIDRLQELGLVA